MVYLLPQIVFPSELFFLTIVSKEDKVQVVEVERSLSSLQRTIMGIGWMFLTIILLSGVYLLVYKRRT